MHRRVGHAAHSSSRHGITTPLPADAACKLKPSPHRFLTHQHGTSNPTRGNLVRLDRHLAHRSSEGLLCPPGTREVRSRSSGTPAVPAASDASERPLVSTQPRWPRERQLRALLDTELAQRPMPPGLECSHRQGLPPPSAPRGPGMRPSFPGGRYSRYCPEWQDLPMRVGIAHHFGWAVAVTASPDFEVVDRRN